MKLSELINSLHFKIWSKTYRKYWEGCVFYKVWIRKSLDQDYH